LKIPTLRFGIVDIQEEQVISIPSGLIGFPNQKRYVLLEHKKGSPFLWFQSVEDEALAFVLVDPLLFKPDYEIQVSREDRKALELSDSCDGLQTLVIVNIAPGEPVEITANLLGPLLINTKEKMARQIVLYSYPYSTRTPIPAGKR
jgi:flagellar assembly factor FliW